jgi:hypothetical protein
MDADEPLLQILYSNQVFLRAYAYPFQDEVRFTISLENDEYVLASEQLKPVFCPFTGRRNSREAGDMQRLQAGISLKLSKGKELSSCCTLKGSVLSLHLGSSSASLTFAFDPLTGLADTSSRL